MKSSYYLDILRGRSQQLPDVRSKIVRIFVSSTFTDTLTERDSLIENIFPKLKDYCREKYGLEFQYADMRWGIETETANNHGQVGTCLKEIELCKKYSVATNFVVLLGHRYGSRPIPATILASLFDLLKEIVTNEQNENNDAELLQQWYQLDTNCVPPAYILQNISSVIPYFISKDIDEIKKADKEWRVINNRLRLCLRQAAEKCLERGQITESDYDEFFISVTEKEIINGILSAKDANERTLCFFRDIVDIRDHLSDSKALKYIDMSSQSVIDQEADKLLNRLKTNRIPAALKPKNIFTYKVHWSSNGINREDHCEYIEQFNNDFFLAMKEQIDRCVQSRHTIGSDSLQHEVLEHAIQCKTYVTKFHGRTDVLSELEKFVKNNKEYRPCVVYGESGCGKTSVLAKTATEVFKWWPDRSVSVILRFLGTTPVSSTIYKTLLSISEQISELYNIPMTAYPTVSQVRDQLELTLFPQIPDNEYLLILLDSIDQLHSDAYDCKWLPVSFASNIKCILSTLPDHGNILENLKAILNENENKNLFVHVPPFEPSTVEIVYNDWLAVKHRSLSTEQRLFIHNLMNKKHEILPLFMKLMFDIISYWHSYDKIDESLNQLNDVDDCIRYLFKHLEIVHNTVLFSRALCYMTACRSGISQNELEDVLSLDDDVLKSVFQHYIPPVRRLPGILWTRIRNDLDEYITEKEVDDAPVIYWYHRRFIEVARELYISNLNETDRKIVFQNVVDLFKETWKGKNKPFKIDDPKLVDKYKLDKSTGEIQANRFTTSQPVEFIDVDGRIQYNKRKLNELPLFLSKLAPDIAIPIAADEMFFNYSFMHAKFSCSQFIDIQNDIDQFESSSSYKSSDEVKLAQKELSILKMTYLLFGLLLREYPDNFAFELTSRLLLLYGLKHNLTNLLRQCDELSPRHCALIVPYCQIQPPGNGLLYTMNKHTMPVIDLDFTNNQMAAISLSNKIILINMQTGNTALDIKLPKLTEPYLNSTTLPKMIVRHSKNKNTVDDDNDSDDSDNSSIDGEEHFKQYVFFVNSFHNIYLVSSQGDIKFHRTSIKGYSVCEIISNRRGLCILVEPNSNSVECWSVGENKLFSKIDLSSTASIKTVVYSKLSSILLSIVLHDGTILFYMLKNSIFIHRGTINAGKRLDKVTADKDKLICTFDSTVPIDFVYIDLNCINQTEDFLSEKEIIKTSITFDPPIGPKPIEQIILPDDKENSNELLMKIFFMILTKECLYVVHACMIKEVSYIRIPGQCDVVSIHAKNRNLIYTSRGGIVNMYKWKCTEGEDDANGNCHLNHEYQLLVSIDISSSPVLTIKPAGDTAGLFLCSMQNGVINAYHGFAARQALKKLPPLPRTTELVSTIQLSGTRAITLDASKRELCSWVYQYSTSIESKRHFPDSTKIDNFAVLSETAVLIITNTYWAEIYALKSLNKEPLFRVHLRNPSQVFSVNDETFIVITNDGSVRCITRQINKTNIKYNQTPNKQLNINCTRLFCSMLTLNSKKSLVVLADDEHSLAIWTANEIIYMNIDLSQYASTRLIRMTSEINQEIILFYFENKSLCSCRIQLSDKNSFTLTPFDTADIYALKNNCLATAINGENQLNLHNINLCVCHEPIQLENECEQLCLNESGNYVFTLVKPRVLCMYRVHDRRQLARLFVYDFVTTMIANNDFIILAINDRRLLTLMIADPDDPTLQSKIQALPSRNLKRDSHSAGNHIVEQIETFMEMSSDDFDTDFEDDQELENKEFDVYKVKKMTTPTTSYRYIHRLNKKISLSKIENDEVHKKQFIKNYVDTAKVKGDPGIVINVSDDDDDDDDVFIEDQPSVDNNSTEQETNLDGIRQKVLEHDQQQIKGIYLANAGANNIKIVNNYSVTSSTCMLM
ncbi:unnamed protein product [Rotaria socialis]|uniref:NACHT domain-containing protein n=3 Tax=Rotaria TaxID=231623 RepID=A0A820Q760_9BILA|nr:unnamed protein product [Rotaria socialis]CAF4416137.1 unnamed protein product [Rotaria socialis]